MLIINENPYRIENNITKEEPITEAEQSIEYIIAVYLLDCFLIIFSIVGNGIPRRKDVGDNNKSE